MAFITPRRDTNVEVLYTNKDFAYEDQSRLRLQPSSSSISKTAVGSPCLSSGQLTGSTSQNIYSHVDYNDFLLDANRTSSPLKKESPLLDIPDPNDKNPVDVVQIPGHNGEISGPAFLHVVSNHFDYVNSFQILLVAFETHLEVYSLQSTQSEFTEENMDEEPYGKKRKSDIIFCVKKVQECSSVRPYGIQIQCCVLSHLSCISSVTKRLMYAFSVLGSETLFLVREESMSLTEKVDLCSNQELITEIENENQCAVTHLAFNYPERSVEEFLAFLDDGRVCTVLDIKNKFTITTFPLKSPGIYLSFHPAESYKLMTVDMTGFITIFNVAKQYPVQSINLCMTTLYCHWCPANSQMVALGGTEECIIIDLSRPHAIQRSRIKPFMRKYVRKIEFSEVDQDYVVILGKPETEIKLFKTKNNFHTWAKTDKRISAIAWLVGMPYLIALSGDKFYFYDSV